MSHEKSSCALNANKLASAATIVAAVIYVICVAASAWWPEGFLNLMNKMAHAIDLTKIAPGPQITVGSFVVGLLQTVVFTYVVLYVFAVIYNALLGAKPATAGEGKSCCRE